MITCNIIALRCAAALLSALPAVVQGSDFFEKHIRPVLHDHCTGCHGAEKQKGGLRLDSREALLGGGESGPAVVPGKPDESLLLKAVRHLDKDLQMPPPKAGPKLADDVIAQLASWVQSGAEWPAGEVPAASGKKEGYDPEARKQRLPWIWQTPQAPPVPEAPGSSEVDRFIAAKLAEKGLDPAPPADDAVWLRRVHFALTGLPPRPAELEAFLTDTEPLRRGRAVDALLASPHFGERWARHWMDLVRYAESRGHESDFPIANAWRYRDYLIRAFNADVPYDHFVREHIAGDLLPPRPGPGGCNESVIATGWAFLGEENHSPVDIRQDECERVDNKVDVLSKTFLGLTVACARCHDHKFDAISQKDYYALCGFVLSSPFRQVRYETMEAHGKAAVSLAEIRKRHAGKTASAFAAAAKPGAEKIAAGLVAARKVLFGAAAEEAFAATGIEGRQRDAWSGLLKPAATDPLHPLHAVSMLAHEPDAENAARFPELQAKCRPAPRQFPPEAAVIADFTGSGVTPWRADGPVFGCRALAAGDVAPGAADRLLRIMPWGAAVRDPFWNRLSLAPGTEMDSGSLGAAGRAGRTLLLPKFTLRSGKIHYLIRGAAQVYAGVDSHIMLAGPLHAGLVANFDTGGQVRWVTHDLSAYAGHRTHLEVAPQGDAPLEVLMAVESPAPPAWMPVTPWQWKPEALSLADVAAGFQSAVTAVLDTLAAEGAVHGPDAAVLADWAVQNADLLGVPPSVVSTAAAGCLQEMDELGRTIRWDSATAVSWADNNGVDENLLIRGKPARPGQPAPRGLPEALGLPRITSAESSGRAELARQLTDPANPLVARVMVNRVWHHLFGRGIVPTVDNFGYLGERPSHPELLDHLAWHFIHTDRWSLKQLIRRLVLTDAFARSSRSADPRAAEVDPSNVLLHRMNVRRLEGEAVRDALLVISGRLDPAMFGPPVPLHLTEFTIGRGSPEAGGPLDGAGRRSIYTAARRNFLPTMMQAFDLPTPFSTVGRRNVTNVPAQALVMMNDPFVREQAAVWAARMLREMPDAAPELRVARLFETALARGPSEAERTAAMESLEDFRALQPGQSEASVWSAFCHALLTANEVIYLK